MKHKVGFNRLGRRAGHRRAMTRNMLTSLFRYGRIKTTKAKALAIRRTAEKMITRAKLDSVHNRRIIAKDIKDKAVLSSLFTEIGPRFKERPGGYTRVLKLGPRPSDAAEMVILELLADDEKVEKKAKKKATKKAEPKKAPVKAEPSAKEEPAADEAQTEESAAEVAGESDATVETEDAVAETEKTAEKTEEAAEDGDETKPTAE